MNNEIGIIMAAGIGQRLKPITDKIPKPLVCINNIPLIENVIKCLINRSIQQIYCVVGYKHEQFNYLETKYNNLRLIYNPDYYYKNNISSINVVYDKICNFDCFICESDLFITNKKILCRNFDTSGYFGKMIDGFSEDWVFELDKFNNIKNIKKSGYNLYNMCGISYFKQKDSFKIANKISQMVNNSQYYNLFWDEVVDILIKEDNLKLNVFEILKDDIIEIDTVEEYDNLKKKEYEK